ncbi:DUF397 domain-containing protein [Bailinhaonella thermotolerans]|uniref:DUF397 domain-containing protein n=1 Tax=Bailinhaonella thermotolerans TaxID=1070861 RepID=UPI003BEF260E
MNLTSAYWRKSSYSGNNGGNCVEVALVTQAEDATSASLIAVRDSKNPHLAPHVFAAAEWRDFLAVVKAGALDPESSE